MLTAALRFLGVLGALALSVLTHAAAAAAHDAKSDTVAKSNSGDGAPVTYRAMSYNIRYANPKDGDNVWANRKAMVARVIRFQRADLVGLQEALKSQIEDLEKELPEFRWIGVGRSDGKVGGEFTPIFYRAARFELVESGTFWLSKTPDVAGSVGWDAALPRIATWAKLKDKASGKTLFFLNTHFDHRGLIARLESVKLLRQRAAELAGDLPIILVGDLNSIDTSPVYTELIKKPEISTDEKGSDAKRGEQPAKGNSLRLHDAMTRSRTGHHGPTGTFNNFDTLTPGLRIDYIFVSDHLAVEQHAAIRDQYDNRWPSDHIPVAADLEFK